MKKAKTSFAEDYLKKQQNNEKQFVQNAIVRMEYASEVKGIENQIYTALKTLKKIRENLGYTQYTIAEKMGISQNAYYKLEKGVTRLDLFRFLQIVAILEINLSDFFKDF